MGRAADAQFILVDTSGAQQLTFGKTGSGPGEVRSAGPIGSIADRFVVYDMQQIKLVLFDSAGTPLRDVRMPDAQIMIAEFVLNDSTAVVHVLGPKGERLPATMSLKTGRTTTIVSASDSFLATFAKPDDNSGPSGMPTFGRWLGGIVIADSRNYRLALYDWEGTLQQVIEHADSAERPKVSLAEVNATLKDLAAVRQLSSADLDRQRKRLMDRELPYFPRNSNPSIDDQGRLWVLGEWSDSAFADLFGRDGFIGRLILPCRGIGDRWQISGVWLGTACEPDGPDFLDNAVLKVFRIKG